MALITINIRGQELLINAGAVTVVKTVRLDNDKWGVQLDWLPKNSAILKLNNEGYFETEQDADNARAILTQEIDSNQIDATIYRAAGSLAPASIDPSLLIEDNLGKVYNITGPFTTTANFVEGPNEHYLTGTNIVVIETTPNTYMFDVLGGSIQVLADAVYIFDPNSPFDNMDVLEVLHMLDEDIGNLTASNIGYDNSSSGLAANDTQEAIEEIVDALQWTQ